MTKRRRWGGPTAVAALGLAVISLVATGARPAAAAVACDPPTQQTTPTVTATASGYLSQLQPERAWALTRGRGMTVALLDTGVAPSAVAGPLAGRVVDGGNLAGDGQPGAFIDCDGRGTADAGLIAGTDGAGALPGLAPEARIVAIRVQARADDAPPPDVIARGIDSAIRLGAQVIVVASPVAGAPGLASATAAAVAAGSLVVAAVGDEATATTSFPAQYPDVVGVAPAPSSSGAVASAQGSFVDLTAPGTGLAGLAVSGQGFRLNLSGSAPAAALAGASAALLRARYPTLPLRPLVALLEQSANHPSTRLPDPAQGWGTVNPYAAITIPLSATVPPTPAMTTAPAVVLPPRPSSAHEDTGALLALALLALAVAALGAIAALRAARRRRWQPGTDDGGAPTPAPERAISPSELAYSPRTGRTPGSGP